MNRMQDLLRALSRFCGLEYAILPSVLRRGSAYILANSVSAEERRARMGHGDSDSTYWKYYRNTTSTVDFQALRHNIPQQNVSVMSSLFLGTDTSGPPPDRVSEEGMAEVYQDPELLVLLDELSNISDELIRKYGSLRNAEAHDPHGHQVYKEMSKNHSVKLDRLTAKKYAEEYRAHFNLGSNGAHNIAIPVPGPSQVDVLLDERAEDPGFGDGSDLPTDPELLEEEAEALEALEELAAGLEDGDESAEKMSDAVQEHDPDNDDDDKTRTAKKPTYRFYGRREIARHTLIDEVPAILYNRSREEAPTWKSLSAHFTTAFNHLHPADKFYPSQEPLPGTYDCRFCDVNFHTMHSEQIHVHADLCEAERLFQNVLAGLQANDTTAVTICPLTHIMGGDGTTIVDCKAKPQQWVMYRAHLMKRHRESTSRAYSCLLHETPFLASTLQDFRAHIVTAHNVPTCIINYERPGGGSNLLELIYFCPFCQV